MDWHLGGSHCTTLAWILDSLAARPCWLGLAIPFSARLTLIFWTVNVTVSLTTGYVQTLLRPSYSSMSFSHLCIDSISICDDFLQLYVSWAPRLRRASQLWSRKG